MPYSVKGGTPAPTGGPVKRKRIWWRVLLAWLGGFIAFPLVLAGAGAIIGTAVSTKSVVSMFGGNPDEVLGESYQSKTILQTVMDLVEGISTNRFDSLGALNEVSPKVKTTVEDLFTTLANSLLGDGSDVRLDWDAIKDKKFTVGEGDSKESPMATELKNQLLGKITIKSLFNDTEDSSAIFNYFMYPVKYVPEVDGEGNPVLDGEGNPIMIREGFDLDNPYSLSDLLEGSSFFDTLTSEIIVGDVIPNDSHNALLDKMSDWKLDEISSKIDTITVGDIVGDSDALINDIFGDKTLEEMKNMTAKDIVLIDVFGEEIMEPTDPKYNRVIAAIIENIGKDDEGKYKATVDDLSKESSINDLKVSEIMDADKFTGVGKNLLDALDEKNATFGNMGETIGKITMGEFFGIDKNATSYDEVRDDDIPFVMWSLRDTPLDDEKDSHDVIIKEGLNKRMDSLVVKEAIEIFEEDVYDGPLASGKVAKSGVKYYSRTGAGTGVDPYVYTLESPAVGDSVEGLFALVHEKSNSVLLTIKDCSFNDGDGIVDSLKNGDVRLKDVITIDDDSSKLMKNLGDTYLTDLDTKIKTLKLNEMIDVYEENEYEAATGVAVTDVEYYSRTGTPGNYVYTLEAIPVGDPVTGLFVISHEKSHPILISLKDVTVLSNNGLQNKFKSLKFNEVFTEEDCQGSNVLESLWKNNGNGDFVITDISDAMKNVKITDLLGDDMYETEKVADNEVKIDGFIYRKKHTNAQLTGMTDEEKIEAYSNDPRKIKMTWWFLLTENGETFNDNVEKSNPDDPSYDSSYVYEKFYILKNGANYNANALDSLVANLTEHMKTETLFELYDAGFLTCNRADLEKTIYGTTTVIGTLTISEFIALVPTN